MLKKAVLHTDFPLFPDGRPPGFAQLMWLLLRHAPSWQNRKNNYANRNGVPGNGSTPKIRKYAYQENPTRRTDQELTCTPGRNFY